MTERELGVRIFAESEKYGEWELGDIYRTLARIELEAKRALEANGAVAPQWLLQVLEAEES